MIPMTHDHETVTPNRPTGPSARRSIPWRWGYAGGALVGVTALASIVGLSRCDESRTAREIEPSLVVPLEPPPFVPALVERIDYGPCVLTRIDPGAATPRCVFDEQRDFRVWVDAPDLAALELRVDGVPVTARLVESDPPAGTTLALHLPPSAERLEILGTHGERWDVPLQASDCSGCHDGGRARVHGELDLVREELVVKVHDQHPLDTEAWMSAYERADQLAARVGLLSDRIELANELTYHLLWAGEGETAAVLLARLERAASDSPHDRAALAYGVGLVEWQRGRLVDAALALRTASRHAVRVADDELGTAAFPMYADALAELGHFHAALHWAQRALLLSEAQDNPCVVAANLRTVGWVHLLLRQHGWSSADPEPLLARALAMRSPEGPCPDPTRTGGARLGLAMLALDEGRPDRALAQMLAIEHEATTLDERMRLLDVELRARLALREHETALTETWNRLREAAEASDTAESRWILAMRQGDRLMASGDRTGALAAYGTAEVELDRMAELMGFGIGRDTTGARNRETTGQLVRLFLERSEHDRAFCTARRSEARQRLGVMLPELLPTTQRQDLTRRVEDYTRARIAFEQSLAWGESRPRAQRDEALARLHREQEVLDQQLDEVLRLVRRTIRRPRCEELAAPRAGELFIGIYTLGQDWVVFAADENGMHHHLVRIDDPETMASPHRLSELVLVPMSARIHAATRIRMLIEEPLAGIDWHALPWNGQPLGLHVPVVYGLDLSSPAHARAVRAGEPVRAVLIADPTGSLPDARHEIAAAEQHLAQAGWNVDVIAPNHAHALEVERRIDGAALFHYAGHAAAAEQDPGWWPPYAHGMGPSANIVLGTQERLTPEEILLRAGHVPPKVVLSGCRTGVAEAPAGATTLALAFLAAGAEEVLATTTSVTDVDARQFARAFYEALAVQKDPSLATALHTVTAGSSCEGRTCAPYRVFVR